MSRPTKLTRKKKDGILSSIRLGRTFAFAASKVGVSYETFARHRQDDPKFAEQVDAAMCEWEDVHLANIDRHAKTSWPASAWRLQRAFPHKYADPNVLINIANIQNGVQDPTSTWLNAVSAPAQSALPDAFTESELTLLAPQAPTAEQPPSLPLPVTETVEAQLEPIPQEDMANRYPSHRQPLRNATQLERQVRQAHGISGAPGQQSVVVHPTVPSVSQQPPRSSYDNDSMQW